MSKFILFSVFTFLLTDLFPQGPWVTTNSPSAGRYDDISFINKDTGWAVNSNGLILATKDGGNNWTIQQNKGASVYMRSIEFASATLGFAGALEFNGNNVLFKTTDGGNTWTDISNVVTGTSRGICGICCVDTNYTYAVGVWASPAYILKTNDGGNNWTQIDMSAYASRLIDVEFSDSLNGYVGGQSNITSEGGVILKTNDGGLTWNKVYTSNQAADLIWKIQELDSLHWYAANEIGSTGIWNVCLQSADGGNTWVSKNVRLDNDHYQVVGFMDTLVGWIGGKYLYQTIDGGSNWMAIDTLPGFDQYDRFVRVDSATAYITQKKVYKLQPNLIGIKENNSYGISETPSLSVYPNPARSNFTITLSLKRKTIYNLRIINSTANTITWEEVGQKPGAGEYSFKINQKLSPGIYFVYVMTNEGVDCKKIVVE